MIADFNPQFSRIGEILVHQSKISESQLNQALAQQKNTREKLGQTLVDMNIIQEEDLTAVYALQMGFKQADNFILLEADSTVAALIPEDFARSNRVLAVNRNDSTIVVAMEDPEDLVAIDAIKRLTNLNPEIIVSGNTLMEKALDKVYGEFTKTAEVSETIESITVI